ncbi:MAG: DUF6683 family protein [Pseudomonadota bacterium]
MRPFRVFLAVMSAAFLASLASHAAAQWTFDPGFAPSLMGPVITDPCTGDRCTTAEERREAEAASRRTSPEQGQAARGLTAEQMIAQFDFSLSPERRTGNLELFIAKRLPPQHPGVAELRKLHRAEQLFPAIDQSLSEQGLQSDNLADVYALWWIYVWSAAEGHDADFVKAQAQAVRKQAGAALSGVPWLVDLNPAQKQLEADTMLLEAFLLSQTMFAAESNPSMWPQLKSVARENALARGFDPKLIRLAQSGFVPR